MSTEIGISVSKDNCTRFRSETCMWGVDPEVEAGIIKKMAEEATMAITSRKEED